MSLTCRVGLARFIDDGLSAVFQLHAPFVLSPRIVNAGPGTGDPQKPNAHGMNFGLGNGALFIGEVQYALNPPPANPADASSPGLPGTFLPAVRRHTAT